MSDFKKGDFLISKTNDNGLTIGKHYEIIDEYISSTNMCYLGIIDDNSNYWNYHLIDTNDEYYYNKFFYNKSEIRDMKLKELGI